MIGLQAKQIYEGTLAGLKIENFRVGEVNFCLSPLGGMDGDVVDCPFLHRLVI